MPFRTFISIAILSSACTLSLLGQDLQQDTTEVVNLEGTVFTAEKKPVIYRLDKKTVSGSSSLSASGGSAVDVLKSMPSVRVDADGEVSFRGSTGFLVYVDGKPSMLEGTQALEQIPAENIEDIISRLSLLHQQSTGQTGMPASSTSSRRNAM